MKIWIKRLLPVCAVTLLLVAFGSQLPAAVEALVGAKLAFLVAVFMGLVAYTWCNASIWSDVLAGLGQHPGRGRATRLWIRSEVMKWLPGGIWGYASRVVKAPEIGVGRQVAGASLLVELLLTIAAWGTLATLGLLGSGRQLLGLMLLPDGRTAGWIALLVVVVGLVVFKLRSRIWDALCRRMAPLRDASWDLPALGRAFVSYLGLSVFHAVLLKVLVLAFIPETEGLAFFASVDGLAWLIGFFAVGVPGGIGVREAGMTWLLGQVMPLPEAVAIAVAWRALQLAAEMAVLGGTFLVRPDEGRRTCLDASRVSL
ncbi:lysylphosphatidylglycerol synthase domain-containing protein [Haloferula rosea]|uniref:Flippase-like domain-containing protein n=1 Tax=Haloferula rosea TaxID=490093 RepID=A0A934REP2_9BACT|nr:lysylphosphatidylglycerol synthase domain-containing protein [Haloferula rosea]MBK1828162.1 flippase-like domain-containing protein [Haloferula rosea]